MRVKKFDCHHCGAPKVNTYKNPYVVCDYCGVMIDVDFAAGLQVWNHSEEHTAEYMSFKQKFIANSNYYNQINDRKSYWKEQYNFWNFYYTHYPEYLPPTVPKGEKYELFIQAAADMATDAMSVFSNPQTDAYNHAYANIKYYEKNGKRYVEYSSFLKMMDTYNAMQEKAFRAIYDNPKYIIMHEVLPEKFHLKMKLSQIAQVWLPYLEENNADDFLIRYKLKQEYIDIEEPQRFQIVCGNCKKDLSVPKGALVYICDSCHHPNVLKKTVHCQNCGFENLLPDKWEKTISCNSCGTQLRVVQPLFG